MAKVYGHWITVNYRESYDMFACSGILFNHESPRRGLEFVTRKVTHAAAPHQAGLAEASCAWAIWMRGATGALPATMCAAMWLMLQQDKPDDYVLATGETHSVQELCEVAFSRVGLNWQDHVVIDPKYYRPAEVDLLIGDPTKAGHMLGWKPEITFRGLVEMMVDADMNELSK